MADLQDQLVALEATARRFEQMEKRWHATQKEVRLWRITTASVMMLGLALSALQTSRAQGTPAGNDDDSGLQQQITALQQQLNTAVQEYRTRLAPLETKLARVTVKNNGADIYLGENGGANLHIVNGTGHTDLLPSDPARASGLGNLVIGYQEGDSSLQSGSHHIQLGSSRLTLQQGPSGGEDVFFEKANVHVVNGMGSTQSTNGLGNLIVGYNEATSGVNGTTNYWDNPPIRSGSHNLVIGPGHEYYTYGGLVAGYENQLAGPYTSVLGGNRNRAIAIGAAIVSGTMNTALGGSSCVVSGIRNQTRGGYSVVCGGGDNGAPNNPAGSPGGFTAILGGEGIWALVGDYKHDP